MNEPESKKIYIQEDGFAKILCAACGVTKKVQAAALRGTGPKLRVRCGCGAVFGITVEFRRFYRRGTSLSGYYQILPSRSGGRAGESTTAGSITVKNRGGRMSDNCRIVNLSKTGLRLEMSWPKAGIEVGTKLGLRFELDSARQEEIALNVVIRNKEGNNAGCEFLQVDALQERAIGFYLMR